MENILVVGVNTRAVACSLKRLGYTVYSADYFGTVDLGSCADRVESILDQKPGISCGRFSENFNPNLLREIALEMVGDVDGVISLAGSSPSWFPSRKIIGNMEVDGVEDKFALFQRLNKYFNVSPTYLPSDNAEVWEIISNAPEKKFILKPRSGAGGYGVRILQGHGSGVTGLPEEVNLSQWLLQEFIEGENVSASVLSTPDEAHTILTTKQIIGDCTLGQKEPFGYCGNLVPYPRGLVNEGDKVSHGELALTNLDQKISQMATKVVDHLSLVGSNGVDFINQNGELYVIEVNPRVQGTWECAELSLNLNMAQAHLEACQGQLPEVPPPQKFAVKMVVHALERSLVGDLHFPGVYDLPHPGVIIEEGEPMVTVLSTGPTPEAIMTSAQKKVDQLYRAVSPDI
ncbi:ATP-grasp domain-containing protein [Methanobacterium formicicum]|uniref:ATP-grasp fold domain-containing protein n=1 Tax=Methanobacterium formicicum TaxID=2162 RepID=A0A090I7P4_METFO|nr:ATP-grasp domain-containing protein [Methanobacterium formicicum]MDH2660331.1 ATP-grasp domain-containing protein [Methanobacterium formicicum]CEA13162.1 ATP-grasp fold domain-containing protein [Methanobacterium formicicum]